jgi:selenide,water dikinase
VIRPDEIVTNAGARAGDQLVLTKPLGIGIITTAVKLGVASAEIIEAAIGVMTRLNAGACEAMLSIGVNAATDVTGFGFLGHLHEMLSASGVGARITASSVPFIEGVGLLAEDGVFPGGSARNLKAAEGYTVFGDIPKMWRKILADAQTSGGLLISVAPEKTERLMAALDQAGVPDAELVGEIIEGPPSILLQG